MDFFALTHFLHFLLVSKALALCNFNNQYRFVFALKENSTSTSILCIGASSYVSVILLIVEVVHSIERERPDS